MKLTPVRIIILLALALAAGWLGSYCASYWSQRNVETHSIHSFVHDELDLTDSQLVQLEKLEANFTVKQKSLELSLRAANADLAAAMEAEHEYGPKVSLAIETVHEKMGALQKATVEHIFNMRRLLTDEQQKAFDARVGNALTANQE